MLSLELLRVSVLVLVFFIFLLLASGALSTVCRRKPSRLHLLNAWWGGGEICEPIVRISVNYSLSIQLKLSITKPLLFNGVPSGIFLINEKKTFMKKYTAEISQFSQIISQ